MNNNTNNNNQTNENFLYKYFIKLPYQFLLNCCSENREVSKSEERKLFQILPNLMDDFLEFCHLIKRKIGIIVFYSEENLNFLKNIIGQLSRSTNCINLLKENFMIYPILANSRDGNKIQDLIIDDNNNELLLPSFIFCFNRQNNRNSYLNPILNKNHIIYTLEGESTEINSFYLALKDLSDKYLNKNKNDINSLDKSFGLLTDGEILSQQKFEMEELERKAQIKEEQIKQEKNKEIEDAKKRLSIIEKEIQRIKRQKQNNNNNRTNNNNQTSRGRSVGIKKVNHNNLMNNFGGGMFGDNDPFNDSFFKFPDFNNEGKTDDSILAEQMGMGFF